MLALLIDAVISVTPVETADVAAPPAGTARRDAVVFGVSSDLVTVLDLPALAGDARIAVSDEQAIDRVFRSGISTSPIITDLAGHGLGLAIAS